MAKRNIAFLLMLGLALGFLAASISGRSVSSNRGSRGFELPPYPGLSRMLGIAGTVEGTFIIKDARIRRLVIDSHSLSQPKLPDHIQPGPGAENLLKLSENLIQTTLVNFYEKSKRRTEMVEGRIPIVFEFRLDSELPLFTTAYRVSYGLAIDRIVISACRSQQPGCASTPAK